MTDIMADYKDKKFVVVSQDLFPTIIVLLSDITFWNEHYDELNAWCHQYDALVRGMTVDIPNPETLSLFCLKWA